MALKLESQRHPWTLKKLQFRSSNAWEFAESCGNLLGMAS
jgi:hypothetical protein